MKYAVVFTLFGLVCAFYAFATQPLIVRFLAASFAVAFTGVGFAYAFIGPRAFLKKPGGTLNPLSFIVFWPYHLMNGVSLWGFRRSARENVCDKIDHNVYLGCQLNRKDEERICALGIKATLDLTCEFGEVAALRRLPYLCIPTLDTYAPSVAQLQTGAEWIQGQAQSGPVYVHCALGHGRSATFVAAYLLLSGKANTAQEAVEHIKSLRPRIGLHPQQMSALQKFASTLDSDSQPQHN